MSKLKLNKEAIKKYLKEHKVATSVVALTLAGTLAFGVGAGIKKSKDKQNDKPVIANSVGHMDINPFINFNLDEEDFVVLDMGDHDSVRTSFEKPKAKYCNDHDITLGVIISSDSKDEESIYDDVEYTKNLIREYDIDFPVYLDINKIITNDDLNKEMKTKLIKDFVEKCAANNMYVGLYGTDTNLTRVKEYCDITEYDAFLVMDEENIKYDGSYTICQDLDGKVTAKEDLSQAIAKKSLNDQDQFVNDSIYKVAVGDDITDIALKSGMSVNELLKFNDLRKKDVVPGTQIRIPSNVANIISPDAEMEYPVLSEPIRGCDISYAQGSNINWDKMQENFEYIIIRSSQGLNKDKEFEANALNASQNGIPIGVYCYNNFTLAESDDIELFKQNQQKQADYTLELLKNKKVEYPVFLDVEGSIRKTLNKEAVNAMLDIWVKTIGEAGYEPGLYCNQDGFNFLQSQVDYDLTDHMEVWLAGGEQYTGEKANIPLEKIVPSESVKNKIPGAKIIQATDSATGCGAANDKGHLDINFSYYDYANGKVVGEDQIDDQIKEFTRIDFDGISDIGLAVTIPLAGLGIIGALKKKKKNKEVQKVKTKQSSK